LLISFSGQIFYSDPDYYTEHKYKEMVRSTAKDSAAGIPAIDWSVKTDDFFPYADCDHCYWTGYFTSRAAFKRLERVASSFLLAARQIDALPMLSASSKGAPRGRVSHGPMEGCSCPDHLLQRPADEAHSADADETSSLKQLFYSHVAELWRGLLMVTRFTVPVIGKTSPETDAQGPRQVGGCCSCPLFRLEDALGVAQHHDAISGTGKQHVANDYSRRLQAGVDAASRHVIAKLKEFMLNTTVAGEKQLNDLSYCQLLNESICEVSEVRQGKESSSTQLCSYLTTPFCPFTESYCF
jgi:hypothetical protein